MTFKEIRIMSGENQTSFSKKYDIPLRTVQSWEIGERKPPNYVLNLLERAVKEDSVYKSAYEVQKTL